jgi:hypothetical protein
MAHDRGMSQRSDSFAELDVRSQELLIDFLTADLNLAFTFLDTARLEAGFDDSHSQAALEKAVTALNTVRYFQGHVEDPTAGSKIQTRAIELEAAISAFGNSPASRTSGNI